jgi:hypothetical protein
MNEIVFPEDLLEKFKPQFASAFNEILFLREQVNSLKKMVFAQKLERFVGAELILPNVTLFNDPEQLVSEENSSLNEE